MPDIQVANSHLIGLWLQILATGAYYVYVPECTAILWRKRRDGHTLLFPAVCLLIVSGAKGEILPNPSLFYADVTTAPSLIKNSLTVALAIISDFIIVYRTYVVWSASVWIILIPTGLLCADIAFGIWSTWTLAHTPFGSAPILAEVAVRVKYFFIFTFAVNVICSSLICFKIWRINRNSAPWTSGDRATSRVFEVVIESAALYCAHLFIMIVTDIVGSNVFFIFLDCLPPVTALVFSLLIVRTRTGTTVQTTMASQQSGTIRFWTSSQAMSRTTQVQSGHNGVEINLERVVHSDLESGPTHTAISFGTDGSKFSEL
ncbi:hypothetical protein C8Q80DRAFT_235591 [Daedaleopsis nitida]|nr:hypothetical protein C8Q80DRAFT_235591 [Daedaleopsis nitida]